MNRYLHLLTPAIAIFASRRLYCQFADDQDKDIGKVVSSNHIANFENMTILGGTANPKLTQEVCSYLGVTPGNMNVTRFSDGEISVEIQESIRGKDCIIIQSCAAPVNDNILELLLTITAARRSGAGTVTAVIPYFGYKQSHRGLPISTTYHSRFLWSAANDLAKMLRVLGVDKVISVDLQRAGQGHEACFFDSSVPVETISSLDTFAEYFQQNITFDEKKPLVIVSPNTEYVKKAHKFVTLLKTKYPYLDIHTCIALDNEGENSYESNVVNGNPRRSHSSVNANAIQILGSVKGADVIVIDDFVDTASTLSILCRQLKKEGANRIFYCASHGLFSQNSVELVDLCPVDKVLVTNSVPMPKQQSQKIVQVSIAPLIGEILKSEAATSISLWDSIHEQLSDNVIDEEDDEEFELE